MTSREASTASPSIVWDKRRLHGQSTARQGKPLKPSSAGAVTRRSHTMATPTPSARPAQRGGDSDLKMSFDPMKDLHMWTMWRVAVNGRIVDEARRRNRAQPLPGGDFDRNPFGRSLVKTPLDRFIRVGNSSQNIAGVMMDPHGEGGDHLATQQFVYYGVPRVVLNKPKKPVKLLP